MRIPFTVGVAALSIAGPAYAAGLFGDINIDIGKAVERAAQDTGKAIEKASQDTGHVVEKGGKLVDPKSLVQDLNSKSDDELLSLTLSADPCSEVDCHGVPSDIARQAVGIVRTQKQTFIDLEVRKSQAWAAVISAAIAFLSLAISIASFVRAGRSTSSSPAIASAIQPRV
jgi:hypothetical protein